MDSLDTQIALLLNGQPLREDIPVVCDYTPNDEIELRPIVRQNVYYIVTAVIFNEDMDVLMVQESKPKNRGQWSLPAGKVDPNEQIIDTIRREVLEESGFEMVPVDLVMIESIGNVFNFIYSGRVIGGQLKTVEDSESIEAKWWSESDMSSLNLRYDDILDVISVVRNHNTSLAEISCHISRFIAIEAHNRMLLRVVFTATKENNSRYVLIKKVPSPQLPVCAITKKINLKEIVNGFLEQIFITEYLIDKLEGVLSVEHNGVPRSPQDSPHDGLCITVLAMSRVPYEDMNPITGDYEWMQMSRSLCALITRCLDNPNTELIQWRPKFWCKRPSKRRTNRSSHSKNMDKLSAQIAAL